MFVLRKQSALVIGSTQTTWGHQRERGNGLVTRVLPAFFGSTGRITLLLPPWRGHEQGDWLASMVRVKIEKKKKKRMHMPPRAVARSRWKRSAGEQMVAKRDKERAVKRCVKSGSKLFQAQPHFFFPFARLLCSAMLWVWLLPWPEDNGQGRAFIAQMMVGSMGVKSCGEIMEKKWPLRDWTSEGAEAEQRGEKGWRFTGHDNNREADERWEKTD